MDYPPVPYRNDGIPPGMPWESFIRDKLRKASQVLAFFSNTPVTKTGFVQREYRVALSHVAERPLNEVWLIPVLLDDCPLPQLIVDALSFDQLQRYNLVRDGMALLIEYLKAAAPMDGEVGAVHLTLVHSCWRAPQHDTRFPGHNVYRFDVLISDEHSIFDHHPAQRILDRIQHVTYLLPPAWPTSPITVSNRKTSFGLQELAWSDLPVRANAYITGQNDPVHLSCFIRLSENGPRLISSDA